MTLHSKEEIETTSVLIPMERHIVEGKPKRNVLQNIH